MADIRTLDWDNARPNRAAMLRDPSDRQLLERFVVRRDEAAFCGLVDAIAGPCGECAGGR